VSETFGSNNRAVDVINYLAAHPVESFTLSELAKALELSHGSAHRVLTGLTEARWLSRHPKHKTYSLGLALVAIGQAALEKHRAVEIARREMARLTEEVRAQCLASAIVDDELLLLAREGTPHTHETLSYVGERHPFVPPVGMPHVAWGSPALIEAFLAKAPAGMTEAALLHLRHAVVLVRRRGYAIASNGPALRQMRLAGAQASGRHRDEAARAREIAAIGQLSAPEIQLERIEDALAEGVGYISAPVFAPNGEVAMELTLSGMPSNLSVAEIETMAERLRTTAAVVTRESHGRLPA
jgi:DNA-binding IclR family transcriptional regulator